MKKLKPYILLFLMSVLWGGAFTAAKIAVRDFSPISIIFYRFSLAFIIMRLLNHPNIFKFH
ncbi:EamA family transporter [Flexistipes sinusarabici]|uniref:EamA family transporter n=1 Tax=Flexistipes sinusarabici TaxID=2352 RepID=UPI0002D4EBC1|nr:EamA family transporter [Flexistipes sinusarabici]